MRAVQPEKEAKLKEYNTGAGNLGIRGKTVWLAKMGILGAISVVLVALIHVPLIPTAPYLEYDPADIPILISAFAFGPLPGLLLTVVVSLIQGIAFSASGPYGILMHIIATGVFVLAAGSIYRFKKSKKAAAIALVCGTLAMTAVMIPANLIVTPAFTGMPADVIKTMLLPGIIPFNLIKAGLNSVVTFLLYKRISKYLRGEH